MTTGDAQAERRHLRSGTSETYVDSGTVMMSAAEAWLDSLEDWQRAQGQMPWPSSEEREQWYYTPTDHGGLPLASMTPPQQRLAMRVLASGLSGAGYVTATTIMGLENVLDRSEAWQVSWGRERGRDPQLYWLRVFGTPGAEGPWSWRFGGHHVSIQHTILDGRVRSSTPCFLGADPAEAPLLGGHLLRPLGAAEDLARDLVHSLDEVQTSLALLHEVAPTDVVSANRVSLVDGDTVLPLVDIWRGEFADPADTERLRQAQRDAAQKAGVTPAHLAAVAYTRTPKGLPATAMTREQQDQLRALLTVFVNRVPDDIADRELTKFSGDRLEDVHFAWAGGTSKGEPHYYRLQGPDLLAEYDNTQRDVNHIHTVWRDPARDLGRDILGIHLATNHRSGPSTS